MKAGNLCLDKSAKELAIGEAIFLRDAEEFLGGWDRLWNVQEFCLPSYEVPPSADLAYWVAAKPRVTMTYMRFLKTIVRTEDGSQVWVWQRTS